MGTLNTLPQDGFRKVDHDYIINFAKLAKKAGIKEFHLVSSMHVNSESSNLYLKTKVYYLCLFHI